MTEQESSSIITSINRNISQKRMETKNMLKNA